MTAGLDGGPRLAVALDGYWAQRDAASLPMYELTLDLASFAPPRPEQRLLFEALAGRPAEIDRFLGVLGGVVPIPEYFGPRNLLRLLGPRRMLKAALAGRRMVRMRAGAPDDAVLVLSARSGDPASLSAVLERHRARLLAAAVQRLGHGPQAEDAVQETFVIALRHLGQLRDPAAVGPWLLAILRNVCRAQLRRPTVELTADPGRLGPAGEGGSVEEAIERAALRDWLWAALDRLPEPLRLVVVLRHFTRVSSYRAIADLCGIPVGTVRSRLNAARARLAGELMEAAAPSHPDADAHRRLAEVGAALMAFQRSGDPAPLREMLAPDVSFTLADGVERRGRD